MGYRESSIEWYQLDNGNILQISQVSCIVAHSSNPAVWLTSGQFLRLTSHDFDSLVRLIQERL